MLDFRRHRKTPDYIGSSEQRRLLVLLALSGVVLLLVFKAPDPANWRWLAWDERAVDGQLPLEDRPAPNVAPAKPTAHGDTIAPLQPPASSLQPVAQLYPGVREDYLAEIRDDTVFRAVESDAWFHLLAILTSSDESRLAKASLGRVGYLQLDQQPNEYRGRVVTISGVARGAKLLDAPANDYGIARYYQVWLQPDRSSPSLVVLYCLELPEGFPLGEQLNAPSTATGFFFKRWAYTSQGGITTAPLVLARTLAWQPPPPEIERPAAAQPSGEQFLYAVMGALALAAATLCFLMWRGRSAGRGRHAAPDNERVGAILASLETEDLNSNHGDSSPARPSER